MQAHQTIHVDPCAGPCPQSGDDTASWAKIQGLRVEDRALRLEPNSFLEVSPFFLFLCDTRGRKHRDVDPSSVSRCREQSLPTSGLWSRPQIRLAFLLVFCHGCSPRRVKAQSPMRLLHRSPDCQVAVTPPDSVPEPEHTTVEESKTKQKHDVTKPCTQCVLFH